MLTVMTLEAAVTATAAVTAATVVGSGAPRYTVIAMLAFTMGARNVVVRRLGVPDMTTTVLTTTLTGLAADSTLAGGANPNVRNRATSVVSMFSGALAGAALLLYAGAAWSLGVASVIVAVATTFFAWAVPLELIPASS